MFVKVHKTFGKNVFNLAHVLPDTTEEENHFMTCTPAHHQKIMKIFWLHLWGILLFSSQECQPGYKHNNKDGLIIYSFYSSCSTGT